MSQNRQTIFHSEYRSFYM